MVAGAWRLWSGVRALGASGPKTAMVEGETTC
jgi:hypothetical protein